MMKKSFSYAYICVILIFLYLPILMIIYFSFFNTSTFSDSNGFSLDSYLSIFSTPSDGLIKAIENTFLIAIVSSVAATILGVTAAIGIYSMRKRTRNIILTVNQLPIINSEIVMAVSFMIFFVTFSFPAGLLRLIIAHTAFCTPYVILAVLPKLETLDPNVYEAALDLGASHTKATVKILLPLLAPSILSGFVLAFVLSLDDFIITQINKGATTGIETLSTYIYADARLQGLNPYWFAIFSIIFVVILAIFLILNLKNVRKERKKWID